MPRLLFEKKDRAVWISHLDLMRLFQRAFKRADLPLTHTHGFNPRPSVSIALPMSVGTTSCCELLDFDLDGVMPPPEEVCRKLNEVLVDGVRVLQVYESGRKIRDLSLLQCEVVLEYDRGIPAAAVMELRQLFDRQELIVPKKTKNGVQDQDIIPMIRQLSISQKNDKQIVMEACICCQNPTLNPMQLTAAIEMYLPECAPDFCSCCRLEIFDTDKNVFR